MILALINWVGFRFIAICNVFGEFALFLGAAIKTAFNTRLKWHELFVQMSRIGVHSFTISVITGAATGAVLAYQSFEGFKKFGGENLLGSIVALSLTRELGPVLTGLMVTARAGSSIATELGTMSISEQIDALRTLCINPYQYLVVPRILGATIIMPFLTLFAVMAGIVGGYFVSTIFLGLTPDDFLVGIKEYVDPFDIIGGLIKSAVFGFILASISCYQGFSTSGGAREVGLSATQSVVMSSILIIIANYFLAVILFGI